MILFQEEKKIMGAICLLLGFVVDFVTIMYRNDELSSTMSWVGWLLKDLELFILFEGNCQILLKISVIPIFLTFIYLVAQNLLVNNQLNSLSNSIIIIVAHNCHIWFQNSFIL